MTSELEVRGCACSQAMSTMREYTYLKLGIGPSWDLNDHVQDSLLLIGVERDVVEGRDNLAILLDVDAVLESVAGTDSPNSIFGRHVCGFGGLKVVGGGRG